MRLLYGIQTTGHGHLVRSTPIVRRLRELGHEVHVLLSGPEPDPLWRARIGVPLTARPGLTFAAVDGELRYLRTLYRARPLRFLRDLSRMPPGPWDLIVTDYEPLTAWHARATGQRSIGIGHLYAFLHDVPMMRGNPASRLVLRHFAPVDTPVGSHWDHFGAPILPPLVAPEVRALSRSEVAGDLVLVYLPWEDRAALLGKLRRFAGFRFRIYDRIARRERHGNLELHPVSRHDFTRDLARCRGVITNAGFTLSTEALHLGVSLLVKPIAGQLEQESNALALQQLGLASVSRQLGSRAIAGWLDRPAPQPQHYPDVTGALIDWLDAGARESPESLSRRLWQTAGEPSGAMLAASGEPRPVAG